MQTRMHICKGIEMSCKVEDRGQGWRLYRDKTINGVRSRTRSQIVHKVCPYCGTELEA